MELVKQLARLLSNNDDGIDVGARYEPSASSWCRWANALLQRYRSSDGRARVGADLATWGGRRLRVDVWFLLHNRVAVHGPCRGARGERDNQQLEHDQSAGVVLRTLGRLSASLSGLLHRV